MANTYYELEWKTFLQCKECWEFKEVNYENWYKHKEWYLWVLGRCKECILKWRRTEHEREMARIRDMNRYTNNPQRREYIYRKSDERRERKWYRKTHRKTQWRIAKLKLRPSICPICWYEWRIVAHHPDYNKPYEIVFCCQICHDKIHKNKIECPTPITIN